MTAMGNLRGAINQRRPPSAIVVRIGILFAAMLLAGCAGDVQGVLLPISATAPGTSKITMFVATTRAVDADDGILFSGERGKPSFAEITVSLPPGRAVGEVQWPSRLPGNPATDFVAQKVERLDVVAVTSRLHKAVQGVPKRRVMVFVHGFNNRFEDAVYRFAQIAHDSHAEAVPILFTWPSRGSIFAYGYDRESNNYSRQALERLLQTLARDPAVGDISVLAHSMGNWVTLEALRQMAIRNGKISPKITNVILAAPDVDMDVFRSQVLEMEGRRPRFTVFLSQDDRALAVSRRVWGGSRLGAVDPDVEPYKSEFKAADITVIDLTKMRSGDSLNHGKFAESPEIVKLIGTRLVAGQSITDSRVGLGEQLMQVTAGAAAVVGTAAGLAISAPIAVIDPNTRRNLRDNVEEVGRSIGDVADATGYVMRAPLPGSQ